MLLAVHVRRAVQMEIQQREDQCVGTNEGTALGKTSQN